MDEALVVYDEDGTELIEEAGELAAGVDASVTVLALMTEAEFDEARDALDVVAAEEGTGYDDSVALDAARQEAREAVAELYDGLGLDWNVVGSVIEDDSAAASQIVEVAEDHGVDHVFITGKRRSPTGKAVFGDRAQAVILNFDGPVTTLVD
jgi:nucleotide-binding universal stress UspA family protein